MPGSHFHQVQTQTGWGRTLSAFAAWQPPQPGWLCLDVGCGPGLLPSLYAQQGAQAYGVDLDFAVLRQPLHPALAQAAALRLPFPAGIFHQVSAVNLLFFLPDPPAALREMARLLRPDGRLLTLNPSPRMSLAAARALADEHSLDGVARQSLLNWAARAEAHARWSVHETAALLAAAGLRLVDQRAALGPGLALFAAAAWAETV
ncbi:MAG: class I SAM-dependent methyltransferase [Chloroflexi bacterium]|nr:class I SAM-dependent methyltransferase [Chloroflexota bacterium]